MYTTHDIYVTRSSVEARALRAYFAEYRTRGLVAYILRGQWWVRCADSNVPFDIDSLRDHGCDGIMLHTAIVAWPSDAVNMGKLPNGSVVWTDGERQVKMGGAWYPLSGRTYFTMSHDIAAMHLPKAWKR